MSFVKACFLTLSVFFVATTQAKEVFHPDRLKQLEKQGDKIFEEPKVACYLEGLLGKPKLDELRTRMESVQLQPSPVSNGAYEFTGGVKGLDLMKEGIVLIHPDGRVWAAYLETHKDSSQDAVHYFTTEDAAAQTAPEPIKKWAERFGGVIWRNESFESVPDTNQIAESCTDDKLASQLP